MEKENIIFKTEGNIAIITLNRPEVLNAFNFKLFEAFLSIIAKIRDDDDIRAVVITGTGRAFCSGDDISGMGTPLGDGSFYDGLRQGHHKLIKDIRNLRKPVIAAINGFAHGMGSDLALACDFRIASKDAKLGDLRTSKAITIGSGGTYFLPRLVGLAKAIELLFTGESIDAEEAERIGLVNKVVPADRLMKEVMEFANRLAQGPTKAIGIAKAEIYRELDMDLASALEDELVEIRTPIEDQEEGRKAFFEKRAPKYTGR